MRSFIRYERSTMWNFLCIFLFCCLLHDLFISGKFSSFEMQEIVKFLSRNAKELFTR